MEEVYNRFHDRVEFFMVYVQEAHASDRWQVESNVLDNVLIKEHQTYEEREGAASACSLDLHMSIPVVVEEMDNGVDEAYAAAPDRLYFVGTDGRIGYKGGAGPWFFDVDDWEQAIGTYLERQT